MNDSAVVKVIKATSKISTKIKDNYFTFEYGEERTVSPDCNLEKARQQLWDDVNYQVDQQIEEIWKLHHHG